MTYQALYRRFRPTSFNDVVGQEHIVQTLENQVKKSQINHAYLFCGTRGTGKTSIAKIFAKAINCEQPTNGSPCGKCAVCEALNQQNNMDILEIDAASNNRVEEIRDLRERVKYPPVIAKYKVYIIDEVHMLTDSAFNALLKTLEEPPSHCVFILATTEPHKLPKTILSRCMRFDFRLIDNQTLERLICKIYDECKQEYELDAIKQIAKSGNGSARDTISIADTCMSFATQKLTLNDVLNVLGENNFDVLNDLIQSILDKNAGDALQKLNEIAKNGKNLSVFAKEMTLYFRNLIAIEQNIELAEVLGIPKNNVNVLKKQADMLNFLQKVNALSLFAELELNLKYAINPQLNLEVAILKTIANLTSVLETKPAEISVDENNAPQAKSETQPIAKPIESNNEANSSNEDNITIQQAKQIWGKMLLELNKQKAMVLYSACEDAKIISVENNAIIAEVGTLAGYNILNNAQNKQQLQSILETFKKNYTIIFRLIDLGNNKTEKPLEQLLKEKIGENLIIK